MRDVIGAAAQAAFVPSVVEVEHQRRVDADGGLEAIRRLPRAIADASDGFAIGPGRMQRNAAAIHRKGKPISDETARLHLQAFERAVHVTNRAARRAFLAEDVPGFESGAELDLHVALCEVANAWEAKLEVRREPVRLERKTSITQVMDDVLEIRLAEVRQHPAVVDVRAPAHEIVGVGMLPELGDQSAQQKMLRQAHARVRGHLESAHLNQAETPGAAVG